MTKEEVLTLITQEVINVLPCVTVDLIKPENRLADIGANSIDRSEIAINCMSSMNVKLEPIALTNVKNIGELCEALFQAQTK